MKRILVTTSTFSEKHLLSNQEVFYNPTGRRLDESEVLELIREFQPTGMIAGVEALTRNVLVAAEGLKVISRCGVGLDSVDLETAQELGIVVCNTPEAPVPAVAEMALALMLAWLRRIPAGDQEIRNGKWVKKNGLLLAGKTVGIVGCGRIGTYLSSLLAAFGCTVIGSDLHITAHPTCRMVPSDEPTTICSSDPKPCVAIISRGIEPLLRSHSGSFVLHRGMFSPGSQAINSPLKLWEKIRVPSAFQATEVTVFLWPMSSCNSSPV